MPDGSNAASLSVPAPSHNILERLPARILGGLSAEQRAAIAAAAGQWDSKTHRINIRVSVPLLPKRWYFTILGGPERRNVARRRVERVRNPVRTVGNTVFIFIAAMTFYGVGAALLFFSSSVFEY